MRINEVLLESYDPTKVRIEHPEDLIFTEGAAGAIRAIAALKQMCTNPETVSIKPDGKPAIIWGRDENGFGMADKYMFAKGQIPRSIQELNKIYSERKGGGRETLMAMMSNLWSQFEASVPNSTKGWFFGDLLYSQTPPLQDGNFTFQPNTVHYSVPADSKLGERIAKSTSGIVVHTFFSRKPGIDAGGNFIAGQGRHITKPNGLNLNGPLMIITDQFAVPPKIKIVPEIKQIESFVKSNSHLINRFFDPKELSANRVKDLPQVMKKYVNSKAKMRNFETFGSDFIEWLGTARLGMQKQEAIANYIKANAGPYKVMCQAFIAIMRIKDHIVEKLDQHPSPMTASIGGESGNEGYIVHNAKAPPLKAVSRTKFSAANFNK